MRPHGEVRNALLQAAREAPGSVRELAERAQVGYAAAKYTASRMLDVDDLVVLDAGRPARLGVGTATPQTPAGETLAEALQRLHRCYVADESDMSSL